MRHGRLFIAAISFSFFLVFAPDSRADREFYLADGTRAQIVEGQLVFFGPGSIHKVARPGIYETRNGRHTIIVTEKGAEIRENTKATR